MNVLSCLYFLLIIKHLPLRASYASLGLLKYGASKLHQCPSFNEDMWICLQTKDKIHQ